MAEMTKMKRNSRGKESDQILLDKIREYPSLSQYELGQKLKWNMGHIDGSVRRLLRSKDVYLKVISRNGRKVNLVYPKDFPESQISLDVVEIPLSLIERSNPTWNDEAIIYALDSSTMGVCGEELPEWSEHALLETRIPICIDEEILSFKIPEKMTDFYHLSEKHRTVSVSENSVLITVSGDIVETKKYPT